MDKKELALILEEIGVILELKGENPFKSRAYYNAARQIEMLNQDINALDKAGKIAEMKGIGKALADKITTLINTGELEYYSNLKESIPAGLFDLLKIPGMGPKRVKTVYEKLNISTLGELEYACRENRLRDLDGFGSKTQENILKSIELQKKYSERFLFPVAAYEAARLAGYLRKNAGFIRLEIAGSLRRKKEVIRDIDIVASCEEPDRNVLMDYFSAYDKKLEIVAKGPTKSTITLQAGIHADLRLVSDSEFPFTLHHSTGSKEHNTAMRSRAKKMNIKMNEYGLFKADQLIQCRDENEIFTTLDMAIIPPELRENMGEIEEAIKNNLPVLYTGKPFYGLFHVHTTYSDGANTIAEIAEACRNLEFSYVGICDHSKSAIYANGLNEDRILAQHEEINRLNEQFKDFKIFKGIEVDILVDGSLDYGDDLLANFDFVIASVHSNFGLSQDAMTKRICRALSHPAVTMLGHPTGRLLLGREPYAVDMMQVIETAGKLGKVIEINTSPFRLDLDWRLGRVAKKLGVKTALNPDAHAIEGLKDYEYGIGIARKGWFEAADIINTLSAKEITAFFKKFKN